MVLYIDSRLKLLNHMIEIHYINLDISNKELLMYSSVVCDIVNPLTHTLLTFHQQCGCLAHPGNLVSHHTGIVARVPRLQV